jgi:hypothetical protein
MTDESAGQPAVEVRGFGPLKKVFDQRHWDFPYYYQMQQNCSALDLAISMELPLDKIEAVFVNGIASPLNDVMVKPGDRVGFIPIGVPGPYRVMLGMVKIPSEGSEEESM